jgi:hypothetical protein
MARYASDQFYNFNSYETGTPQQVGGDDNPRFLFPGKDYRNSLTNKKLKLQRGYIRMLTEAYGTDATARKLQNRRFHFQFNPDVLVRSVSARNDVQFWMNQDPGQLVSPIPGDANFAFEFILNREAEVATGSYDDGSSQVPIDRKPRTEATTFPSQVTVGNVGPYGGTIPTKLGQYDPTSVSDIGVLADLLVFDSIIGQGINSDLINSILGKLKENVNTYNAGVTEENNESTTDEDDKTPITLSEKKVGDFLGGSVGNSAFLISQPVRIVFSSLYMVEGFITSSTVTFNKFNYAMVPTQCTVSINMQAMYIGFASKDTFLTTTLRNANSNPGDPGSNGSDPVDAENEALQGITLFKRPFIEPADGANFVNVTPSEILSKSSEPTKFIFSTIMDKQLEDAIKAGYVQSINATIDIDIKYKGRDGGGTGGGYNVGDLIHSFTNSQDMQSNRKATFDITRATPNISKPWDTDSDALYQFVGEITFEIFSPSTSTICKQVAKIDKEFKWGQAMTALNFNMSTGS